METGLFNFNAGTAYNQWLESFSDVQRPNGQLPGIIPSSGWGFNWGSGPAWDSAFIIIAWDVFIFTGDITAITQNYENMKLYVDYCDSMAENNLVSFGLGDWCHVEESRIVSVELTSSAYFYMDALLISKFAKLLGKNNDRKKYSSLAEKIRLEFNRKFYRGNGIYAKSEMTALAAALYFEMPEDSEKLKVAEQLEKLVIKNNYKADFGILGAKYILRVLADYGYIDCAFKLLTQTEFPGWGYWIKQGATTLWESWSGTSSQNHIMFGDISAWMYQYLAGIVPDPNHPGFKHVTIKPCPVPDLKWVDSEYTAPTGKIVSKWEQIEGEFILTVEIPPNTTGTIIMPNSEYYEVKAGKHCKRCNMLM